MWVLLMRLYAKVGEYLTANFSTMTVFRSTVTELSQDLKLEDEMSSRYYCFEGSKYMELSVENR